MSDRIAVINTSSKIPDDVVDFAVIAINDQLFEMAELWKIPPMPLIFAASDRGLPPGSTILLGINDTISQAGVAGYHSNFGGIRYGEILANDPIATMLTLGHEAGETQVDSTADQWEGDYAKEVDDPVQEDSYQASPAPKIDNETRPQLLPNYVLPNYFDPDGAFPFDRMQKLKEPLSMTRGGYQIKRSATGNVYLVFAKDENGRDIEAPALAAKMARPHSRLMRRLQGRPWVMAA